MWRFFFCTLIVVLPCWAELSSGKRIHVPDNIFKLFYYPERHFPDFRARKTFDMVSFSRSGGDSNVGNYIWQYAAMKLIDSRRNKFDRGSANPRNRTVYYFPTANLLQDQFRAQISNAAVGAASFADAVVIGAGAQGYYSLEEKHMRNEDHITLSEAGELYYIMSPETVDNIRSLSRSASFFSVRGDYTAGALRSHGISALSLGCPSLFLSENPQLGQALASGYESLLRNPTPRFVVSWPPERAWRHAINIRDKQSLWVRFMKRIFQNFPGSIIVNQEAFFSSFTLCRRYGLCLLPSQVVNVTHPDKWIDLVCSYDAGVGARIHGMMALVACEKPVFLYAIDHRVGELAARMKIPFKSINAISESEDLLSEFSEIKFNARQFDRNRAAIANSYIEGLKPAGIEVADFVHTIRDAGISIMNKL